MHYVKIVRIVFCLGSYVLSWCVRDHVCVRAGIVLFSSSLALKKETKHEKTTMEKKSETNRHRSPQDHGNEKKEVV
jgi:hypothetical protein